MSFEFKKYNKSQIPELLTKLRERAEDTPDSIVATVREVLADVKKGGDAALRAYGKKFDGVEREELYLTKKERDEYINRCPAELRSTIEKAAKNIFEFHEKQKHTGYIQADGGKVMGQRVIPLSRVGMYVPGGTAAYPSSVLMTAIPATVAGVKSLVMTTPPKAEGLNPAIVCAAEVAGVTDILMAGGAQAVAALAYGTESVKRVDKIVGPGNIFVATAKRLVFGHVDIDMIAGPSEVLVIADDSANPAYVAADLLSQAEHDPMAASVLVATSEELIAAVNAELVRQTELLPRSEIAARSLNANGAAVLVSTIEEAVELSNEIAPEHLELAVANPFEVLGLVENAGSVFLGHNTPEPLGDYFAGPNHVLPTNGTARFASALSVESFVKRSSYLYYSREALEKVSEDVIRFAESEGLGAHANSVRIRFNKN